MEQSDSPLIKITLELAKNTKKTNAIINIEDEIKFKLKEYMKINFHFYGSILKILTTTKIDDDIPLLLGNIFEKIKCNLRIGWFPISRIIKLLEKIRQDLNKHIIKLLGNKIMELENNMLKNIFTILDKVENRWSQNINSIKREIQVFEKLLRTKFPFSPYFFISNIKTRIKDLKNDKEFLEFSQSLIFSEDEDEISKEEREENLRLVKEIQDSYKEFSKVDIFDFSEKGEKNWIDAQNEYKKKAENIEIKIYETLKIKIDNVKLETDFIIKEKIEEFYKNNGKYPKFNEIIDSFDQDTIYRLGTIMMKWKNDIYDYTILDKDLNNGDSLDKNNFHFYRKAAIVFRKFKERLDSPIIKITLELSKNLKKNFSINYIEDIFKFNLQDYFENNYSLYYNILQMLKTKSLIEIPSFFKGIFENIKYNINLKWNYIFSRTTNVLEKIKIDLNKHIIIFLVVIRPPNIGSSGGWTYYNMVK